MAQPAATDGSLLVTPVRPHDHTGMRRDNLAAVLRVLRAGGPAARAELARSTGLNKATVSSLVGELADRGLARHSTARTSTSGRPGQLVEVVPRLACGVGLEIGAGHLAAGAVDLTGSLLAARRIAADVVTLGVPAAVDALAELTLEVLAEIGADTGGPVRSAGVTVAVPGLVDGGVVRRSTGLDWHDQPVADLLADRLPATAGPVRIDNDAKLAALAEHAAGTAAGTTDLLYLAGGGGTGAGMIVDGRLLRGSSGHSGEVGHLPLDPMGPYCRCGRRGCWDTQVGLAALFDAAAAPDDTLHDPRRDLPRRLDLLAERARSGDRRTLAALHRVGTAVGVGTAALVNLLDPAVVVLGGYFTALAEWIVPLTEQELAERALSPSRPSPRVVVSDLGLLAPVHGGAEAALQHLLADPTLVDPVPTSPAPVSPAPGSPVLGGPP